MKPLTPKKLTRLVTALTGGGAAASDPTDALGDDVLRGASTLTTVAERGRMIGAAHTAVGGQTARTHLDGASMLSMADAIGQSIAERRMDADEILRMVPEINQAASIVIPSILAPNDMRNGDLSFACDAPGLSDTQRDQIASRVSAYFNEEFKLNTRLREWLHETLYRTGAKPLLVVPQSELDRQFNTASHFAGLESWMAQQDQQSCFAEATPALGGKPEAFRVDAGGLSAAVESYLVSHGAYDDAAGKKELSQSAVDKLARGCVEALTIVDNPDFLKLPGLSARRARHKLTSNAVRYYKDAPLLNLAEERDDTERVGHPLYLELPSEAVIPVHVPGSPREHLGYFILLDEHGNPAVRPDRQRTGLNTYSPSGLSKAGFDELFRAYGLAGSAPSGTAGDVMTLVYQRIIEDYLSRSLKRGAGSAVAIGSDQAVYRHMLSRYLEKRHTRLLFVPKGMLTYMAFKLNRQGVGESKLEDIKFILSLRITFLIARMMAAINRSLDRRTITAQLSEKFKGNVTQHVEAIYRTVIEKAKMPFSYNPDSVVQSIARKSHTVKVQGIAGAEAYSVSNEPNERGGGEVDEALGEELGRLLTLMLDVPPSALQMLSENEYSRSIAVSSLIFAAKVVDWQNLTCEHTDAFVQNFVSHSKPFLDEIARIIESNDEQADEGEPGTVSANKPELAKRVRAAIRGLHLVLPKPQLAPDKTQLESLEAMMASVDTLINASLPNELADQQDSEQTDALGAARALAKAGLVREYMRAMGITTIQVPELTQLTAKGVMDVRQALLNLTAGIKEQRDVFKKDEAGFAGGGAPTGGAPPF